MINAIQKVYRGKKQGMIEKRMASTIQGLGSRVCCCRVDKALLPRSLRELQLLWNGSYYNADVIGIILGIYWDNGKENGTCYNGLSNALKRCEVCFCKYFLGCTVHLALVSGSMVLVRPFKFHWKTSR